MAMTLDENTKEESHGRFIILGLGTVWYTRTMTLWSRIKLSKPQKIEGKEKKQGFTTDTIFESS